MSYVDIAPELMSFGASVSVRCQARTVTGGVGGTAHPGPGRDTALKGRSGHRVGMTDPRDRPSTSGRSPLRHTRRSVLAVSAGVLTAGCSLPGTSTSTPTPLDRQALERVAALDPPPVPARELPVEVTDRFRRRNRSRIRAYLEDYETHRDALVDGDPTAYAGNRASEAREWLAEVRESAPGPDALFAYFLGRRKAAEAAVASLAAAGETDADAVRAGDGRPPARVAVRERLTGVDGRFDYRAADPARGIVTFATVEDRIRRARALVSGFGDPPSRGHESLDAGELAARQEGAAAHLDAAAHLIERQRAAAEAPRSLGPALAAAVRTLQADVHRRLGYLESYHETPGRHFDRSLPPVVADVVTAGYDRAQRYVDRSREPEDAGRYATALVELHRGMAALDAFRRVRGAVADGEYGALSAASLRARKLDALAAGERFLARESPLVAANAAVDPASPVAGIDRRLGRALDTSGEEPSVRETARRAYRLYARAATELDALPGATDRFLAAVRAADRGA